MLSMVSTCTFIETKNGILIHSIGFGSEEVRNQVAGHLDSRTYRNNYQDQCITLDVASLVRGQKTEDALLRKFNDVGLNADPNANIALPRETHQWRGVCDRQTRGRRFHKLSFGLIGQTTNNT